MDNLTPTFYHAFSLKSSGYHLIVDTSLALLGVACPPPPQNKTVLRVFMVAFTTLTCCFCLERISTLPFWIRVYPASLSHLCRVTLLWPFKHQGTSVTVLAATPPPPALSRRQHLKPAFGGTSPPLPHGAPYTSNTLPARDCTTPPGYGYSIATFEPSPPRPLWVPGLGFSASAGPPFPNPTCDHLYHGR